VWSRALAVIASVLIMHTARAAPASADGAPEGAEAGFAHVLDGMTGGRLPTALKEIDRLAERYPNWQLAHLVHGDLLLARSGLIAGFGNAAIGADARLDDLRAEAIARLRAVHERPPAGRIPRYLLQFDGVQRSAVVVDAARSRVYVFENVGGVARLVRDFYSTLGRNGTDKLREGDRKTPLGVYYAMARIAGAKLPDLYGWGAFPINYPNEWDRMSGRTGRGIWLHGVPRDTYARAPRASDGCIALANADIAELAKYVQVGSTPVIIGDQIEWATPAAVEKERETFFRQLEDWRRDWESLDAKRYLSHYAQGFRSGGMNLAAWSARKRRTNADKRWIRVTLKNVSVFRSPGKEPLMVVSFDQDYHSSNLEARTRKRQYWAMEDGRWRIVHETAVARAPVYLPESFPLQRTALAPKSRQDQHVPDRAASAISLARRPQIGFRSK